MNKLAIVIPAYKGVFFKEALDSISNQTCKDFACYIGDDNSPDNLYEILEPYKKIFNIKYKRFSNNLGGNDLVAHWERCIDLTENEEWIWLFSDDDLMSRDCVACFYNSLKENPGVDLFHFQMQCIDENNKPMGKVNDFSEIATVEDFLINKLKFNITSSVVEYVFRKSHFIEMGRFEKYDLAWCSDDATWIKLGKNNGIYSINSAIVYWRNSRNNISNITWDKKINERKLNSQIEFARWILDLTTKEHISTDISSLKKQLSSWLRTTIKGNINYLTCPTIKNSVYKNNLANSKLNWKGFEVIFFFTYKIYRTLLKAVTD